MKQKSFVATCILLLSCLSALSQKGYIYLHYKSINEANATNFTCHISGGSTTVSDFILNDKPDYIHVGDIGSGNGAGRGELWAISNGTSTVGTSAVGLTGTIYHRSATSSQWTAITTTGSASAVDGAGANSCVYVSGNNVYYYNGTTTTQIFFSTGSLGNATDVTYANGITAIVSSNGALYYYNGAYGNNTSSNTNWNLFNAGTGNTGARIDLNWNGTTLAYITASATSIKTIPVNTTSGATTTSIASGSGTFVNGSTGTTISGAGTNDIAYDSTGNIYTIANVQYTACSGNGTTGIVFRRSSGGTWSEEGEGRGIVRLTGGAGDEMWGTCSVGFADAIWTRATDNTGSHVWLDDERVRTNVTYGNSIMIPVTAGTYTFSEDLPSSSYDLGRYNIYDPTGNTTGTPATNSASINVAAGETVNIEIVNEYLVPKSIDLVCQTQILQTFGTGSSSSNTEYGPAVDGTAYHYATSTSPQDGYYFLVHNLVPGTNWFTYTNSYTIADHTVGDVNGYFLVVNASYAKDEFFRQRVTNLVPGLQYTISFYLANVLNCNPIKPNINYGLQDLAGNIIDSASTGDISSNGTWTYQEFTFTATASTADLYLRNNNIGGLGNDVALDDISLNPVLTRIGANEITPTVKPNLCLGTSYTFSNTVTGGTWLSSNPSIASINPVSGVAVTHAAGSVIITYKYINSVGCESDTTRGLDVTAPPTLTTYDLLGKTSCLNQPDSLYAQASGTAAPFTYAWTATPAGHGLTNATAQNTSAQPTASGTYIYTVTATDTVGCTVTADDTLTVSVNSAPTVTLSSTGTDCVGGTGSFTLTASQSGGTGSYSWSWSGTPAGSGIVNANAASTTANPTVAGTFTYTVRVSDGYCIVPVSTTKTAYASPSVSVSPASGSNITVCSGGTIGLAALASSGTTPYSYYWTASGSGNGLPSPNPTTSNPNVSPTSSGTDTYSVLVTDANGCTATGSTVLNITVSTLAAPSITITSPSSSAGACADVGSVNLRATVSGGGINTYLWSGPGTITNPNSITTASVVPSSTGFYTLTVTNTLVLTSCTVSANTPVVTAWDNPAVTSLSYATAVCTNTKDTLYSNASGGTGSYTYAWTVSPGSGASITSASAQNTPVTFSTYDQTYAFTVTATDGNGCTATDGINIAALSQTGPSISGMASAATLCANSTLSFSPTVTQGVNVATITGTSTFSSSHSGSHPDTYINDNNTSTYWQSSNNNNEYVGIDFGSSYTINSVSVTPRNNSTGRSALNGAKIQISTDGSSYSNLYTYTSNAPSGTSTYSVSGTGRYLRILFANGTTGYLAGLSASYNQSTSISSYAWSANPSAGAGLGATNTQNTTATPTVAGTYKYYIEVVDQAGCAATDSTGTQTVNASPTLNPLSADPAFCGTTGSIQLFSNPSGGSGSYSTYSWTYRRSGGTGSISFDDNTTQNPVATVASTSSGSSFVFTTTVTDANSCTATDSTTAIVVTNFPVISATAALAATPCVGQVINLTGTVTSSTTGPYNYLWSPSSNSSVTPASTTTSATTITASGSTTTEGNYNYGLSVLDANNCLGTASTSIIAINDTPQVAVALGSVPTLICANPSSTLNLTGSITSGTTSPYSYSWSGSGISNINSTTTTAQPTTSGAFGFTATDANGCTGTSYSSIVTVDEATPSISVASCGTNSDGLAWVQLYESNGASWLWSATLGISKFYTSSALSPMNDASTSTSQSPYIKIKDTYTVNITKSNGCKGSGSIDATIALGGCTVLSTSILDFTLQKQGTGVLLQWISPVTVDNDHYDIERSADGNMWQGIGAVKAQQGSGNITYKFTDALPIHGTNYYRLKQVDINGRSSYSQVRKIEFTGLWAIKQYPNPASDYLILEFNNDKEEKAFITIQTASGSTVFAKEQTLAKGFNRLKLNQVQPLAQGTYFITLSTASNLYHAKFVKGEK